MRRLLAAAAAAVAAVTPATADESIVTTPFGALQGSLSATARVFRGVPYAAPPVGSLRWQDTEPFAAPWSGIRPATQDPPGCMQHCEQPPHVCPSAMSEDCLYLNVFTPRAARLGTPLPVMVWFHGGNFRDGFCGGPLYDGTSFVSSNDMIVVAASYRLGALGFLFTGNNTEADPAAIHGNFGLADQREALRWVRANIAAFGGDPGRVTISGQSAGAMSVASHLVSPASKGLFHGAIMQSEPFSLPWRSPASWEGFAVTYGQKAGCATSSGAPAPGYSSIAACLREQPAETLVAAQVAAQSDLKAELPKLLQTFMPWTPVWGVRDLPTWPLFAFQAGGHGVADVPILLGTVHDEAVIFIYEALGKPVGALEYWLALDVLFGLKEGTAIAEAYPLPMPVPADNRPTMAQVGTDALFHCSIMNASLSLAGSPTHTSPLYLYSYNHLMSFSDVMWGPNFTMCWGAVCHGADLVAVWQPHDPTMGTNYTTAELDMSSSIEAYWGSFVINGKPGTGLPTAPLEWPALDVSAPAAMLFNTPSNVVSPDYFSKNCSMWEKYSFIWY